VIRNIEEEKVWWTFRYAWFPSGAVCHMHGRLSVCGESDHRASMRGGPGELNWYTPLVKLSKFETGFERKVGLQEVPNEMRFLHTLIGRHARVVNTQGFVGP
jgi:hypothetical protein